MPAASEENLNDLLAAAPELTEESARVLLGTLPKSSRDAATVARLSLLEANTGFTHLPPEELRDLSAVFTAAYGKLTAGERARLEAYLVRLRGGNAGSVDEEAHGRQLFNAAILALKPAQRTRLQLLYAHAIAASLAARKEGVRQALNPPTVVPEPLEPQPQRQWADMSPEEKYAVLREASRRTVEYVRPTPRPTADPEEAADAAKRKLADGFKSRLRSAEQYLAQAEARLKAAEEHWSFVNSHTNQSFPLNEARRRLESAKREHERARKQKEDVEDAARRESIPPGWLR
jgi:hypothetical protein